MYRKVNLNSFRPLHNSYIKLIKRAFELFVFAEMNIPFKVLFLVANCKLKNHADKNKQEQ